MKFPRKDKNKPHSISSPVSSKTEIENLLLPSDSSFESVVDLLEARAAKKSDVIAYRFLPDKGGKIETLTYGELAKEAQVIAAKLQQQGLLPGDRAVLVYPPGISFISAYFGCLYAGVIAVPVYPPFNAAHVEKLQHIIQDSQPKLLLATTDVLRKLRYLKWLKKTMYVPFIQRLIKRYGAKYITLTEWDLETTTWLSTDNIPASFSARFKPLKITSEQLAYLQYTSGSTGHPKGVMITHHNILDNLTILCHALKTTESSSIVSWLPHYHDMGMVSGILQAIFAGCPLTFMSPLQFLENPWTWLKAMTDYRCTVTGCPNFSFYYCAKNINAEQKSSLDLSSLDGISSGGEPVYADILENFYENFKECGFRKEAFFPTYGIAEATLYVGSAEFLKGYEAHYFAEDALQHHQVKVVDPSHPNAKKLVSCGPPSQAVCIVDPKTHRLCQADEIGEIWIHGQSVAIGYWQRAEETRATFQANIADDANQVPYLRTGDLGFLLDGQLYIAGRIKDIIIVHGLNHYPQDIEYTVSYCDPMIRSGCVAAFLTNLDNQDALVIVCEVKPASENIDETYYQLCRSIRRAITDKHELTTSHIILIPPRSLPKTTSGKVRRRYTKEKFDTHQLHSLYQWPTDVNSHEKYLVKHIDKPISDHLLIEKVQAKLIETIADILKIKPQNINLEEWLSEYGIDSVGIISLTESLNTYYGLHLTPAILFDHATLSSFSHYLVKKYRREIEYRYPYAIHSRGRVKIIFTDKVKNILARLRLPRFKFQTRDKKQETDIAIIGMSGKFPGANDLQKFWDHLIQNKNSITEIPASRWNWQAYYGEGDNQTKIKWGGFIDGIDEFDAGFFNISPREAELMDPQQRLFLETIWKTIEDAGYTRAMLSAVKTGLFVGVSSNDYREILKDAHETSAHVATGNTHSMLANRVSYFLNLNGPSEAIDTACSSSLMALHNAVKAIQNGDCEMALVGGVNAILTPSLHIIFSQAGMLSQVGQCKIFDKTADGYVRGEGVGAVLLKRLSKALVDGDVIYGVIKGTAVNHGGHVNSLTVPNPNAQAELIMTACERAKVDIDTIGYIETGTTGTAIGDPIEVNGLKKAFSALQTLQGKTDSPRHYCGLSSVKTNIGHLEAASSMAGIIKTLLAMRHGKIPANLNFKELNPYIDLKDSPFYIVEKTREWTRLKDKNGQEIPRRAGVSAFGFGGANAHAIFEEALPVLRTPLSVVKPYYFVTLSAKTDYSLRQRQVDLATWLEQQAEVPSLENVSYTLNFGREHFEKRCVFVVSSIQELQEALKQVESNQKPDNYLWSGNEENLRREPVFNEILEKILDNLTHYEKLNANTYRKKLLSLGDLYVKAYDIDWKRLHVDESQLKISLPTYPFSKERFWVTTSQSIIASSVSESTKEVNFLESSSIEDITNHLKNIIVEVVKIQKNHIDDNTEFNQYNIDSLLGIKIMNRIKHDYKIELEPNSLFLHPTLNELASLIQKNSRPNQDIHSSENIPDFIERIKIPIDMQAKESDE